VRGLILIVLVAALAAAPAGSSGTRETSATPTGKIVFSTRFWPKDERIVDNWEIFAVNAAGGRPANFTRNPRCNEVSPVFSHDGRWIAFVCGAGQTSRVVVMRHDRSARRTVIRMPSGDLAWSADDRQLAFAGARGISVVNADGKGLRRLSAGRDTSPSWSADGKTIAFSREARGASHVFRMRVDGTGQRHLAERAERPEFSPDGKTIAFLRNGSVWLMDADGGRQRRLPRGHRSGLFDLTWSPDGRYLAYLYQHWGIHVVAVDGTSRRRVVYRLDSLDIDWGPKRPS
jgi:Tol biopolymer transport system component